eukprot:TRINITY_DN2276_c0_g1_i1.p1 TRINITY_DN2276_c0_g1~~TRINITY_DN2276_c0_g1_i1.p1  ORF type:complete len:62 (+),score=5.86 TRINITY_DN2276_c0_g1_i1:106-291(+)
MQGFKDLFFVRRSDVQKAVQALNGAQVDGRQITVESATRKFTDSKISPLQPFCMNWPLRIG